MSVVFFPPSRKNRGLNFLKWKLAFVLWHRVKKIAKLLFKDSLVRKIMITQVKSVSFFTMYIVNESMNI